MERPGIFSIVLAIVVFTYALVYVIPSLYDAAETIEDPGLNLPVILIPVFAAGAIILITYLSVRGKPLTEDEQDELNDIIGIADAMDTDDDALHPRGF